VFIGYFYFWIIQILGEGVPYGVDDGTVGYRELVRSHKQIAQFIAVKISIITVNIDRTIMQYQDLTGGLKQSKMQNLKILLKM